ncbi:nickel pincer cofactor biosynthesis protein LarC [uncultured Ruthenibacterium sp.]|uniref:nickel pincer cofactor biosynthesis protein LarC n=1 Tax=uncultured Ruthenibacterium sp. TaxID=1905347 RepID=UPI00349ECD63
MKTLYLECSMGVAGDMLMAALYELCTEQQKQEFLAQMRNLGLPGVEISPQVASSGGIAGTHMQVTVCGHEEDDVHKAHHTGHAQDAHHHPHTHRTPADVQTIVEQLTLPHKVRTNALQVYKAIAQAEAHVHGVSVADIHFHEVGTLDAIADVVGVCLLIDMLGADEVIASPIHVGRGQVRCAHGVLPVPAPATAYLLQGVPIYSADVDGELCTPTGAALVRHFAKQFCSMPYMTVDGIGYGLGTRVFSRPSCVRAFLGENAKSGNTVTELQCNLDDMTGESLAYAVEQLLRAGAKDVFTTPVYMKKGRPGVLLTCVCEETEAEHFAQLILQHTTTLGVREHVCHRYCMERECISLDTKLGTVHCKHSHGYNIERIKPEYEDLAAIARETGLSLEQVQAVVQRALIKT